MPSPERCRGFALAKLSLAAAHELMLVLTLLFAFELCSFLMNLTYCSMCVSLLRTSSFLRGTFKGRHHWCECPEQTAEVGLGALGVQGMTAGLPLLFWGDLGLFSYLNVEHFKEIRK